MKTRFIALFLTAGLLSIGQAGARSLTLEECRQAAVEHNRTLQDARFDLEAALQTRREALTNYFPQISASGGAFQAQHGLVQADSGLTIPQMGTMNLPISMVKRGMFGCVTAVQPVFAGLKIVNGNKLACLGEEVGQLQVRKTEGEVREQTDTYYWQIVALKDNLSTIEAVDRRVEYQLAEKNVEAQRYQTRMERGKRLPTVGVGAGYLYYNMTEKDVDDGMVFAQVSVPISAWWGGAHALKKARIREDLAENDRLQAREMLAVEIEKSWSDLQEAYAQIVLARRSVDSATENLRENRNFYQAGTAPLTDLLDAETLYTQSLNNLTSAFAAYRTAMARYMRVTGR